jgi:hypothetical protein
MSPVRSDVGVLSLQIRSLDLCPYTVIPVGSSPPLVSGSRDCETVHGFPAPFAGHVTSQAKHGLTTLTFQDLGQF